MLSTTAYHRLFRISAWYDLLISWPFAMAFTLTLLWDKVMIPFNASLGFAPLAALDVHAVLFGNFFGSVVVIWALVRLILNNPILGVYDGFGRLLFSIAMVNALAAGISPIVWGFLVPEFALCLAQLLGSPALFARRQAT